ncbi:hypothetical protein NECAME_10486 [Necator americanus]|uniref:Transporter, major facilitator family protein n=1 Tax=Necator americanus TaxID=51031 RepID=W2T8J8_NECAM|nr:hypothetical protein NECAME_10486 [Necator americanus]ETN78203.1 hypothetical protein NECAME_10486 [Necator americanus]
MTSSVGENTLDSDRMGIDWKITFVVYSFLLLSIVSLGQFISTLFLAFHPISAKKGLIADSWFLIAGSVVTLIPRLIAVITSTNEANWHEIFWSILCIGRFLVGCGAGIGFVCVTIVLYDEIPYISRPAHFLVLGLAFAFGTLVINVTPLVDVPDLAILVFASALSAASGFAYLVLQPKSTYKLDSLSSEDSHSVTSSFPAMLVYVLMALNVVNFSATCTFMRDMLLFRFGLSSASSSYLSIGFPLVQMILILILYKSVLDRKILIVGGYIVAIIIQVILLITSFYPYLPTMHKTVALSSLFWLLAVVCCVPCNTALCLITEQFASSNEQMTFASRGRALMWVLATISTGTFTWTMEKYGFSACFAPYVIISAVLMVVLIIIYPRKVQEQ